jgi:hypothetical protein
LQQFPIRGQIVNGNADQQESADDVDSSTMTGKHLRQLPLEHGGEQGEDK